MDYYITVLLAVIVLFCLLFLLSKLYYVPPVLLAVFAVKIVLFYSTVLLIFAVIVLLNIYCQNCRAFGRAFGLSGFCVGRAWAWKSCKCVGPGRARAWPSDVGLF